MFTIYATLRGEDFSPQQLAEEREDCVCSLEEAQEPQDNQPGSVILKPQTSPDLDCLPIITVILKDLDQMWLTDAMDKVEEIFLHLQYENQCDLELEPQLLEWMTNLGVTLCITPLFHDLEGKMDEFLAQQKSLDPELGEILNQCYEKLLSNKPTKLDRFDEK